jgi:23S rRNA pseudouridine1911/1915/1917 synthase
LARARVDADSANTRLDQWVARIGGTSVHSARRLIADGRVTVDGRRAPLAKKGSRLLPGQEVEVEVEVASAGTTERSEDDAHLDGGASGGARSARSVSPPLRIVPEPELPLSVLYCDAQVVAVNKPAGIASHPLRAGETGTLANRLVARFPECAGAGGDWREGGLAHRLDRETSGVLIAARDAEAWRALRRALKDASCEKSYLAEVVGRTEEQGTLSQPIGRSGRRGSRVKVGQGRNPLPAVTTWEVIEPRVVSTLLRARLHAGRAHQVRAHLAAMGHPIVGDDLYGDPAARALAERLGAFALRLHAESVRLRHPHSGGALVIEAPPPEWARGR